MVHSIHFIMLLATVQPWNHEVPEALGRAFAQRMSFKTSNLHYDTKRRAPATGVLITHRYEYRSSGEDTYWYYKGDENGIRLIDPNTGQRVLGVRFSCSPKHIVRQNSTGDEWFRHDGEPNLRVIPVDRTPELFKLNDPRSIGLSVQDIGDKTPSQWLEELQSLGAHWTQKKVDGLIEVTLSTKPMHNDLGNPESTYSEQTWVIDPEKGHAVVEVRNDDVDKGGVRKERLRTQNKYELVDGRWALKRCEVRSAKDGVIESHEFKKIEYDRSEHPKRIDPDILNLPPGIKVGDLRHSQGSHDGRLVMSRHLGGGHVVTDEEWKEEYKSQYDEDAIRFFELSEVRTFGNGQYPNWWGDGEKTLGLDGVAYDPDMWEAYVQRWILRHNHDTVAAAKRSASDLALSAAQIEAAWAILKDCRKRAEPVQRKKAEWESKIAANTTAAEKPNPAKQPEAPASGAAAASTSDDRGTSASQPGTGAGEANAARRAQAPNRFDRELGDIFEQLKQRLNGLLRTKQISGESTKKRT